MAPPLSIGNVLAISPAEDFDTLGDKGTTVLGDDEKKGYTNDAANTNDDGLVVFTKKSMGEGGRQKHSNGVGSRNCFFTPIQVCANLLTEVIPSVFHSVHDPA
jgi:hypothetical protein